MVCGGDVFIRFLKTPRKIRIFDTYLSNSMWCLFWKGWEGSVFSFTIQGCSHNKKLDQFLSQLFALSWSPQFCAESLGLFLFFSDGSETKSTGKYFSKSCCTVDSSKPFYFLFCAFLFQLQVLGQCTHAILFARCRPHDQTLKASTYQVSCCVAALFRSQVQLTTGTLLTATTAT